MEGVPKISQYFPKLPKISQKRVEIWTIFAIDTTGVQVHKAPQALPHPPGRHPETPEKEVGLIIQSFYHEKEGWKTRHFRMLHCFSVFEFHAC